MNTTRIYLQKHQPIELTFNQNRYDFIVEELPNKFSNKGNYLILKIKKEYVSTWELIKMISQKLNIDEHLIGYCGLKDKNSTSTQYISIPLSRSRDYESLNSKFVKVEESYLNDKKLKIGDIQGNRFTITLKDVEPENLSTLYQTLAQIQKHGFPNYFGYQRFGKDNDFKKAKDIVYGEEHESNKKMEYFLISSYQSYFFNAWLAKRVELSKNKDMKKLDILDGDLFVDRDKKIISGLMPGRGVKRATSKAQEIEKEFDDIFIHQKGSRRAAFVVPKNVSNKYNSEKKTLELNFDLPSGSYATVLIENLVNRNFKH